MRGAAFTVFNLLAFQEFVHVGSSTAAIAHGEDDGCTTTHDVTTGKDFLTGRLHTLVDDDGILTAQFQTLDTLRYKRVGTYANSHDDLIDIECHSLTFDRYRTATTRGIGLTQFHHLQHSSPNSTILIGQILYGVVERQEVDAFLLGMLHLL